MNRLTVKRFNTLDDWLSWQEQLHSQPIDLGLERIYTVACALGLLQVPTAISHTFSGALAHPSTVVTIAGTNGKGSCIKTLEQCLLVENGDNNNTANNKYRVGSYTSPHLHNYCERICINGEPVTESLVCDAFEAIDNARGNTSLTYFEFGVLAALWIFSRYNIPYILLEVGLGGRLDAVNIVDTDIAVITSIGLDHQEWLGTNREVISQEKLGIARLSKPLVIAEDDLTPSLSSAVPTYRSFVLSQDYFIHITDQDTWTLDCQRESLSIDNLPKPCLPLNSVAAALMVLDIIDKIPSAHQLRELMKTLRLPGRFEQTEVHNITIVYDVAHNEAAALYLATQLRMLPTQGKTYGVIAMMDDKDHHAVITSMKHVINHWYTGNLEAIPRATRATVIGDIIKEYSNAGCTVVDTLENAFELSLNNAQAHDRIVVFGSFHTVAAIQASVSVVEPSNLR